MADLYLCGLVAFPQAYCKLDSNRISIKYASSLGRWSQGEMQSKFESAFQVWARHADLVLLSERAGITIEAQTCRIDGPSNTLAWSELGCSRMTRVRQCYDTDERWVDSDRAGTGEIDIISVLIHELGHALGLPHTNERGNIMYPAYSGPQRELGPWDIKEIQRRYGKPQPKPPGPGGGGDGMDILQILCKFGVPILQAICASLPPRRESGREGHGHHCSHCESEELRQIAEVLERASDYLYREASRLRH